MHNTSLINQSRFMDVYPCAGSLGHIMFRHIIICSLSIKPPPPPPSTPPPSTPPHTRMKYFTPNKPLQMLNRRFMALIFIDLNNCYWHLSFDFSELGCQVILLTVDKLSKRFPWLNKDGVALASLGMYC